jgi:hypothetical protein
MNASRFFGTVLFILRACICTSAHAAAYNFVNVADTQTSAPSGSFSGFGFPSISGSTVAFTGYYGGSNASGVFSGSGGVITTISKQGDAAPIGTFVDFGNAPTVNNGTVAFTGRYNNGSTQGVFTGGGSPPTTIITSTDQAPSGSFNSFSSAAIGGGNVAFGATYDGANKSSSFRTAGGPFTIIAPTAIFGGVAISGNLVATSDGSNVFIGSGGAVTTIAKFGDAAPLGTFVHFDGTTGQSPAIDGGKVAFGALYNGGGNSGIFIGSGGPLTTIVKSGDPAPIGTFSTAGRPSISGATVAFVGFYDQFGSKTGVFTGSGGPLVTVIKAGDSLFSQSITSVGIGTYGVDPSGTGRITFDYTLANGVSGVAIAYPVPESSALSLVCFGTIGVSIIRRRCNRRWSSLSTAEAWCAMA